MRKKTSKKTARATFGRGQGRATRGLFRRCRALRLSALPRYALVFRASVHPGSRGAATFQCVGRPERRDARTDSGHERRLHQRRQRVRSAAPHRGAGIDQSHHADPRQCALSKMSHRPGIGQISRLRTVVLAHLLAQPQSHRTPVEIRQEGLFVLDLLQRLCALQTGHLILSRSNSNHTQGRPRHLAFPPLPDLQKIKNYATVEYIHATGVTFLVSVLHSFRLRLESRHLGLGHLIAIVIAAITAMGLVLAVLHGIEAAFWAAAYLWLGALDSPGAAILYSVDSMATRGASALTLQPHWQMMGALEAADGMLLFGISTAFIFTVMQFYYQRLVLLERPAGSVKAG